MDKHRKTELIEALYGERSHENIPLLYDPPRKSYLPVQSSPLREYVQDVNRFLFSGGINLSGFGSLPDEHPAVELAKTSLDKVSPYLEDLWENLAIKGEILAVIRFGDKPSLEYFDFREYKLTWQNGKIVKASVYTRVVIDECNYIYKFKVDESAFYEYPLVKEVEARYYEWDKAVDVKEHNYGFTPVQQIRINPSLSCKSGKSEFNWSAIHMAKSIVFMEYGLDENVEYFGNPIIDSPDPKATLKALNGKSQVLQKLPPDEGGGHELLQPSPLSADQLEYLKYKKSAFRRLMGITNAQETQLNDASGAALRIMNDALISKAQTKWGQIVDDGICPLIDKILWIGQLKGLYNLAENYLKPIVSIHRSQPFFALSEPEKIGALTLAQMLVDLGVDRVYALQETYYTHLSLREIEQKLRINLEDVL